MKRLTNVPHETYKQMDLYPTTKDLVISMFSEFDKVIDNVNKYTQREFQIINQSSVNRKGV